MPATLSEKTGTKSPRSSGEDDLEGGTATLTNVNAAGLHLDSKDPDVVGWDGEDDPENPMNWSTGRKWGAMGVVAFMCFGSPLASSMIAPAMSYVARDSNFMITDSAVASLVVSIFVLGYAFGPLIAAPASELYGRAIVMKAFALFFFVFAIACAVAMSTAQLIVFRFLAGIGGSAPLTAGAGLITDLFAPHERGTAMALFSLGPLVGPICAPIIGGFVSQRASWHWTFWLIAIVSGVAWVVSMFLLKETYAPILLERKARKLRKETGNDRLTTAFVQAHGDRKPRAIVAEAFVRPLALLFTNLSCFLIAVYQSLIYGLLYLSFVTITEVFQGSYGWSVEISGLAYLGPGIGMFVGIGFGAATMDKIYGSLTQRYGEGRPEFRVPTMMVASILVPAGLFMYGWTADKETHWIAPLVGLLIFCAGVIISFLALQTYTLDAFKFSASAIAATTVLRSIAGGLFPLFGKSMFDALGLGWGNSLLAFVALAIGIPYPIFFWFYGPRIRAKSNNDR